VVCGNRAKIHYKSFWTPSSLPRDEATAYLAWLDAVNIGTHYDWMRSLPKNPWDIEARIVRATGQPASRALPA
jgi:hypothetical protein